MKKILNKYLVEIFVFAFALFTRFFRLDYPNRHIFDEVYHAFTAQQLVKGNPAAWEWWNTPPPGFAYEWTHPPLAKEFMALAILVLGDGSFAWRFFSALFGTGVIVLIYFISLHLFNRKIAIIAALVASLDGLLLVMSRIAMNDSYFLFFSLFALFLFLKNKRLLMGVVLGLAIASKWTGFFTIIIIGIIYIFQFFQAKKIKLAEVYKFIFALVIIPLIVYVISYLPFFLGHHSPPGQKFSNFQTFVELQQQMWWYHTNLKATHPYQSKPSDWVLDLRPVWLYVDYQKDKIANIYTLDNPIIVWFGLISILFIIYETLKKFSFPKFFIAICYFGFFILWFRSPRIMFNYHYLASTVFLAISTGIILNRLTGLKRGRFFVYIYLLLLVALFVYFYPLWTGVYVPVDFNNHYFWLQTWR